MSKELPREERVTSIVSNFVALMWVATRHFSQWVQRYGLTHPQFITLVSLAAHRHPCTMRDLTEVTFQDPPTMTGVIDRLVKMGLVERTRSETDRRVVLVEATQAGVDLCCKIKEETTEEDLRAYDILTDEELTALDQSLKYMLRLHVGRYTSLSGPELEAEVERLQHFRHNPIYYMKTEDEIQLEPRKQKV